MPSSSTIRTVQTTPFSDQRPGTSGLRKKTRAFTAPHYLENFVQAVLNAVRASEDVDLATQTLVVGGDGRYYNRTAIHKIIALAAGNGVGRLLVARGGLLSTPAMSAVIRRKGALGGLILSASHNPGGPEEDFGIKYNTSNGGPAPESVTERIYAESKRIASYRLIESTAVDLDRLGSSSVGTMQVAVIDPLADYTSVMEELFDFGALRRLFHGGFRLVFDGMHGITGPYANHIFVERLGAPAETVINGMPLEDFGGYHPDPNLVHAADLVRRMGQPDAPGLGAACDGDGDRNLILGPGCFVTPGDSLAVITEHAQTAIRGYRSGLVGVARSMPTSTAVDRVAGALGIPCFETPTGWKFFGNLMDAGKCTICGEESFGTGSDHVREKDGLWAVLCWLSILAATGKSVPQIVEAHWRRFGRSYYQRHDFEGLDKGAAEEMLAVLREKLPGLVGNACAGSEITKADDFSYADPVDGSVTSKQGIRIVLADGSRIVTRLSGTGTEGAILRLYVERYRRDRMTEPVDVVLMPLVQAAVDLIALKKFCGRGKATVIT